MNTTAATHTPGPWTMADCQHSDHVAEIIAKDRTIANLPWPGEKEEIEMIMNARLIAAAPDMLATLKTVSWLLADLSPDGLVKAGVDAVIAKATGAA